MLSRVRIGTRLGLAFGIVSLLLLGTFSAGLLGLNSVKETVHVTLERDVALAANSALIQKLALQGRRYEKDAFINIGNPEKVASYYEKWEGAQHKLEAALQEGGKLASVDEIKALYSNAGIALQGYVDGFNAVYRKIRDGSLVDTASANKAFSEYKQAIYRLEELAEEIEEAASARVVLAEEEIDKQYELSLIHI